MTDKEKIIDGKTIECPCYIDRPLHRYDKACLIQSQAFKEQQTEEKPILRCDEIKNCPIKENFKQLQYKEQESKKYEQALDEIEKQSKINCEEICGKNYNTCEDKDCLTKQIIYIVNKAKGKNNGQKI